MKKYERRSMEEEMHREAEQIEKEVFSDEKKERIEATPEMDAALLAKIQAYEQKKKARERDSNIEDVLSDEDKEALRIGREMLEKKNARKKVRKMPRRRKVSIALVAVMVLVFAFGMTSLGSKSYLKALWERMIGSQKVEVTNVEDMDSKEIEDENVLDIYKEIKRKLGFSPVQLIKKPKDMIVDNYEIDEYSKQAKILYVYKGSVVTYSIYANQRDSSLSQKKDDKLINTFIEESEYATIDVEEYKIPNKEQKRYVAKFEYKGIKYQLIGIMEKSEFINILKELKYL
ncbi:DUF4367 domain-containing protein [Hespellia stercorisuis]|uniref:DUF4367 domain-containing protein n=1 Tax=Hespellia stercorisuis DSM 15480 TaxID=1121950 RepID=A0A1M6JEL2_9FIRM|nr:DUF4367 domain-containing protein [Hespellia stercorisuis]SHJ45196.1 protein of unknown function [Hespellia stercorisuis DSM 15480]